jgi:hypothetical protein
MPRPHRTQTQTRYLLAAMVAGLSIADSYKSVAYRVGLSTTYAFTLLAERLGYRLVLLSPAERDLIAAHRLRHRRVGESTSARAA